MYACVKKCATTWSLCTELSRKGYVMSEAMQANEAQTSDCSTPFTIPWRITQVRSCCQVKKISNQLFIASSFSDTFQIFPALIRLDLHTSSFRVSPRSFSSSSLFAHRASETESSTLYPRQRGNKKSHIYAYVKINARI